MAADPSNLRDLIEFMSKALVDFPDEVKVVEDVHEQTTMYKLYVNEKDRGKVIGKQGRTAHSLRTILMAASAKLDRRSVLEIVE
jgi:predicted RNA-binding protein YlqC (UPF0109 family)